jgi:hypothetical protein
MWTRQDTTSSVTRARQGSSNSCWGQGASDATRRKVALPAGGLVGKGVGARSKAMRPAGASARQRSLAAVQPSATDSSRPAQSFSQTGIPGAHLSRRQSRRRAHPRRARAGAPAAAAPPRPAPRPRKGSRWASSRPRPAARAQQRGGLAVALLATGRRGGQRGRGGRGRASANGAAARRAARRARRRRLSAPQLLMRTPGALQVGFAGPFARARLWFAPPHPKKPPRRPWLPDSTPIYDPNYVLGDPELFEPAGEALRALRSWRAAARRAPSPPARAPLRGA